MSPAANYYKKLTQLEAQLLLTQKLAQLIMYATTKGIGLTLGEAYRTLDQQKIYYAKKLTKTMNSRHMERLAIDLNVFIDGKYRTDAAAYSDLATYWQSISPYAMAGYFWGWDANHFEIQLSPRTMNGPIK